LKTVNELEDCLLSLESDLEGASNSTVGIVGSTGSGKTTLVDLLLGLLTYDSGKITVDGVQIDKNNFLEWRKKIGYVPQSIYLTDDVQVVSSLKDIR
jgi:ATP-binding cassette, subfamily B, bacterial PglK